MKQKNIFNEEVEVTPDPHKDIDEKVEKIARGLCEKFGSDLSYEFYCKVAYKLSEAQILNNYEKAQKGKNPGGLFNYLCRKDMQS